MLLAVRSRLADSPGGSREAAGGLPVGGGEIPTAHFMKIATHNSLMMLPLLAVSALGQRMAVTTFASLDGTDGAGLPAAIVQGRDGNLYGTAGGGGRYGHGTVFKLTAGGALTPLVSFALTNGEEPYGGLVQAPDGSLYGTTFQGGQYGRGTVFKLAPDGALTTLVNFSATNGGSLFGRVAQGTNGNLYGTTAEGGTGPYAGTVFELAPEGELTTLVTFHGTNGDSPWAGLTLGSDGNFYGTTAQGGDLTLHSGSGVGTVFRLKQSGAFTSLAAFEETNGAFPEGELVEGRDGSFYGTTVSGGAFGHGTLFKVTTAGILTALVSFDMTNGGAPYAGLLLGTDGNFYGTASQGGNLSLVNGRGAGTLFRMSPDGRLTTLVIFGDAFTNGGWSFASLLEASDGNLYGTTGGGKFNKGSIFRVSGLNLVPKFQSIQISGGLVHLAWGAIPGRSYRVQYRTDLGSTNWTDLPGDVVANSSTAVKTDAVAARHRFYRVLLLP